MMLRMKMPAVACAFRTFVLPVMFLCVGIPMAHAQVGHIPEESPYRDQKIAEMLKRFG